MTARDDTGEAAPRAQLPPVVSTYRWVLGILLMLAALLAVAMFSARDLTPPPPVPESATESEFSSARAATRLAEFAGEPRPIGTSAGDAARNHLVDELRDLGMDPEVQTVLAESPLRSGNDGSVLVGEVDNVVAVLPGSESSGRVFLVAHYDTVMHSPGAADNGAGVASVLETVRALKSGPSLRNDVVVVFTDGEEPGLLGAEAFVREHALARDGGVVLNLEASGSHGPSTLFETTEGNGCLIDAYATAPHPYGDSSTAAFYALSGHNTDLNVFAAGGFEGLNSAFSRGSPSYHTPQDSIDRLSQSSLQHHGANLLGLARTFGATDLSARSAHECTNTVFFSALGGVVRFPVGLALPLALTGLAGIIAAVIVARRRRLFTIPGILMGCGASLVPPVVSSLAALGLWQVLVLVRPGYADLGMGDPYRPELYRWAVVALTAAILVGWYSVLRRRIGPLPVALGALLWVALLGVLTAWAAPGSSFLFVLPALTGGLTVLPVLFIAPTRWWVRLTILTAGAAVTMFFLPSLVWELSASVGIASSAVVAFILAVLVFPQLSLLDFAMPDRPFAVGVPSRRRLPRFMSGAGTGLTTTLMLVSGTLTGAGLMIDRFDAEHPRPAHLHYVLDADTGTATWVSRDRRPSEWTCGFVDCAQVASTAPDSLSELAPWTGGTPVRTGAASAADVIAPEMVVLDDRTNSGIRTIQLQVRSPRDAPMLSVYADQEVQTISVDGHPLADLVMMEDLGDWRFGLEVHAPAEEGTVLTLTTADSGAVRLRVVDHSYGLEGIPGFATRPTGMGIAIAPSDVVSVSRTATLPDRAQ